MHRVCEVLSTLLIATRDCSILTKVLESRIKWSLCYHMYTHKRWTWSYRVYLAFPTCIMYPLSFPSTTMALGGNRNPRTTSQSREAALERESRDPWFNLMSSSFVALVRNDPLHIKSLEIRDLNITEVSAFTDEAFEAFLSQLTSFSLSIKEWENGVGWHMNTQQPFSGFADCLDYWFFNNLQSVEEFIFDVASSFVLGKAGQAYYNDIGLRSAQMPRLRELTLRNIIICKELEDFIVRHVETIEEISLQECHAIIRREQYADMEQRNWLEFFTSLTRTCSAPSAALQSLGLLYDKTQIEMLDFDDAWDALDELIEHAKEKLKVEPSAKAFFYANVSGKYGARYRDVGTNLERLIDGCDDQAWRKFIEVLESKTREHNRASVTALKGEDRRGIKRKTSDAHGEQV
ncbi:hypothetical protein BJY04DRAFT_178458 [Aspergillus karnatakaensis]|uniref:uncharacterized protein n=1 Tax=Aspergillus karnatakaensis TaxID=1810916 RepID=UPI003CCE4DFE